jgi:hypothetical protein
MVQVSHQHIQFVNFLPKPISELGVQLIADGRFVIAWLETMRMCPFVGFGILLQHTLRHYHSCTVNREDLEHYFAEVRKQTREGFEGGLGWEGFPVKRDSNSK